MLRILGIKGITYDGFRIACELLVRAGADAIEVSGPFATLKLEDAYYFLDYTAKIAEEIKASVILAGGNKEFDTINQILNDSHIAYFSMARPFIAEPNLVSRWADGDRSKQKCIRCTRCTQNMGRCLLNTNVL